VYGRTRQDPGITDPALTEEGRRQIAALAEALRGEGLKRLIASPYTRALETAAILAAALDIPVIIDPIVGERAAFACDVGTCCSLLRQRWPEWQFDHLEEQWWPDLEEAEHAVVRRALTFRQTVAELPDWRHLGVVSHWGFIRALTGVELANGQALRFDPTLSEQEAMAGRGGD
jgi:broad specificity phosphatase PhoE